MLPAPEFAPHTSMIIWLVTANSFQTIFVQYSKHSCVVQLQSDLQALAVQAFMVALKFTISIKMFSSVYEGHVI